MTITKCIKGYDEYGYKVHLNFNGNGETVNTVPGGILSFLLTWIFRIYLVSRIITLWNNNNSKFLTVSFPTDYEELGTVDYKKTKILIYY